jgi:hypothetical protein
MTNKQSAAIALADVLTRLGQESSSSLDDESLLSLLRSSTCPEALADWALRHGRIEHQAAYLFQPDRPAHITSRFLKSRLPRIVAALLDFDERCYVKWARDLGFVATKPNVDRDSPILRAQVAEWLDAPDDEKIALWRKICYEPTDLRREVDDWLDGITDRWDPFSGRLVARRGHPDTLPGDLARGLNGIMGDHYRNASMNWGDYDIKQADLIHTTLKSEPSFTQLVKRVIAADIAEIYALGKRGEEAAAGRIPRLSVLGSNAFETTEVETAFRRLQAMILIWCERNFDPIPRQDS